MQGVIDRQRLIWPGLAGLYESIAPYSYVLIRVCAGAFIMYQGYAKLFFGFAPFVATNLLTPMGLPFPQVLAYGLGIVQLLGGAALIVGLLTRPIALLFAIEMIFSIIWRYPGIKFQLIMLLIYVVIFFRGAERWSLDWMIGKEF
jgi:putative oxidoreductase